MLARTTLAVLLGVVAACADIATAPAPMAHLDGSIRTSKGEPVVGANVYFEPTPRTRIAVARTSSSGTISLDLAALTYDVYIDAPFASGLSDEYAGKFRVAREGARFDYVYTGLEVSGTVTGPAGEPLTNAYLRFQGIDNTTYVQSRFDGTRYRAYVSPGRLWVSVNPPDATTGTPGFRTRIITVAADTTINFSLTGYPVTGTVTDPTGIPMPGALVTFDGGNDYSRAYSDPSGLYRLYVPAGVFQPFVGPPYSRENVGARSFSSVNVAGPTSVDFALSGITWSGTVRASDSGAPIVGADLYASDAIEAGGARARTDASGTFVLYLKAPAEYRIDVYASGYQAAGEIAAPAVNDSTFDLFLDPAPAGARRLPTPAPRAARAAAR